MNWANFIAALAVALIELAIKLGAQPKTMEDAKTPDNIRAAWADYLRERLRDKDGGH